MRHQWLQDLRNIFGGLDIKHVKAHKLVWQGFFFFHSYLATSMTDWARIFTGLLFYACWDTPTVRTSLWQLPIVSSAFNRHNLFCTFIRPLSIGKWGHHTNKGLLQCFLLNLKWNSCTNFIKKLDDWNENTLSELW